MKRSVCLPFSQILSLKVWRQTNFVHLSTKFELLNLIWSAGCYVVSNEIRLRCIQQNSRHIAMSSFKYAKLTWHRVSMFSLLPFYQPAP